MLMRFSYLWCLLLLAGCNSHHSMEDAFSYNSKLISECKCINRVRPAPGREPKHYQMWIGCERYAFIRDDFNGFILIHKENKNQSQIDSIERVFKGELRKMRQFGILDICPFVRKIVFDCDSKYLPDTIKNKFNKQIKEITFWTDAEVTYWKDAGLKIEGTLRYNENWYYGIQDLIEK